MMDKFGVDEKSKAQNPEKIAKAASEGCPTCGRPVRKHGSVYLCPVCGSEPFEEKHG